MMSRPDGTTTVPDEIRVRGGQLVEKVNELIAAGNVRKIIVKHDGHPVVEFPLTVGVIGTLLAPQVAALGAIAALITECTIEVIRKDIPTSTP
jgi:Domain of unknown function (DUF4342)